MESGLDIIVIGAGPAGIAASLMLVHSGFRVAVLTSQMAAGWRADEVIESVEPVVEHALNTLGVFGAVAHAAVSVYNGIYSGTQFTPVYPDPSGYNLGSHLSRGKFNDYLIEAATAQGVTILRNRQVTDIDITGPYVKIHTRNGNRFSCRYVIDATGKSQCSGRKPEFETRFESPPLTVFSGLTKNIAPAFWQTLNTSFQRDGPGWTWLAPCPSHQCSWTRLLPIKSKVVKTPPELLLFDNGHRIRAANVRWRVHRPVARKGIVLAGDAAGILDPAAGQGILWALWSGKIAAEVVARILDAPEMESQFLEQYDNWFLDQYLVKSNQLRQYYLEMGIIFL